MALQLCLTALIHCQLNAPAVVQSCCTLANIRLPRQHISVTAIYSTTTLCPHRIAFQLLIIILHLHWCLKSTPGNQIFFYFPTNVKLSLYLIKPHVMKSYGGVEL
jgi:hypothetical protein